MLELIIEGDTYILEYYGQDADALDTLFNITRTDDPDVLAAQPSASLHPTMDGVRVELGTSLSVAQSAAQAIADSAGLDLRDRT
jgi:hypothetical protein